MHGTTQRMHRCHGSAPLGVIGLATELATSRLPVRRASFLPCYTHRMYIYTETTTLSYLIVAP